MKYLNETKFIKILTKRKEFNKSEKKMLPKSEIEKSKNFMNTKYIYY